jgi:hypothetical protein
MMPVPTAFERPEKGHPMRIASFLRQPRALAAIVAVAVAIGISSLGIVRAELVQPNSKTCAKSGVCFNVRNTGPAGEFTSTATNTRALYVYATSSGSDAIDANGGYIGLIGRAPASSGLYPLVLTDSNGTDLDFTDTSGNFYYHGSLIQFTKTRGGEAGSFACQDTTATMEDVGTARLVNGMAFVPLHRTFAAAIELQADPYRVFLTPNGDTRGLFVAQKTTNGFMVRESEHGRDSVTFDYRVVGTALGHAGQRMGVTQLPQQPQVAPAR